MTMIKFQDGAEVEMTPEEIAAFLADQENASVGTLPVTILYPVDLWSRLTNAEADEVEAAMTAQPVRIQNIFRAASSYRSDHELWPLLLSIATTLFGADRAAEILAASE